MSILSHNGSAEAESDVIVVAVMLGFAMTRLVQEEPFSFDVEPGSSSSDEIRHRAVITAMRQVLRRAGHNANHLNASVSDRHGGISRGLITGRSGGFHLQPRGMNRPGGRHRDMRDLQANQMRAWEYLSASPQAQWHPTFQAGSGQYHGRGAYTGMIDDPIGHHTLIQPTLRRVIIDPLRWNPTPNAVHGLISPPNNPNINLSPTPSQGMGPLRLHDGRMGDPHGIPHSGIVQYTHGMSWAMREAVRRGPWCNAYELAVGTQTTKLASCFPCTTYMYAAGFPPSSCHIGRGESWAPLPDGSVQRRGGREDHVFSEGAEGEIEKAISLSINIRWHSQIFHYMRQGAHMLAKVTGNLRQDHRAALGHLTQAVDQPPLNRRNISACGGNYFLDALTWHKSDSERAASVLMRG